jgi:hypothetical protein
MLVFNFQFCLGKRVYLCGGVDVRGQTFPTCYVLGTVQRKNKIIEDNPKISAPWMFSVEECPAIMCKIEAAHCYSKYKLYIL